MFYIYSFFIPGLILWLSYHVTNQKPTKFTEYVNWGWKNIPHLFGYMFFLYYLEREQHVHTGGADIGLGVFLVPIAAIILLLKIYYWTRNRKFQ